MHAFIYLNKQNNIFCLFNLICGIFLFFCNALICCCRSAALMMGDELHNKFGNCGRPERNDFFGSMNPSARQIYLTFPADSTFREEDVSNYFR